MARLATQQVQSGLAIRWHRGRKGRIRPVSVLFQPGFSTLSYRPAIPGSRGPHQEMA